MLQSLQIKFEPSSSQDVINYILYIEQSPNEVTYDSMHFDIQKNTSVDLSKYVNKSGTYNIGIVSQDDVGNLSSITTYDNIIINDIVDSPEIEDDDNKKIYIIVGIVILLLALGIGFYFLI